MNIFSVSMSFLKIGVTGFGGGSALIPVIEKEIVANKKWINDDDYSTATVIANITPGALPVKLGALWNGRYSLPSSYCAALPGTLVLIILMTVFSLIGEGAVKYIENASVGISVFIAVLLYLYIVKVHKVAADQGMTLSPIIITITAFILTCGREMRQVLGALTGQMTIYESAPLFDISTINLMAIAFFVILFVGGSSSKLKLVLGLTVGGFYALAVGKSDVLTQLSAPLQGLMFALVIVSVLIDAIKGSSQRKHLNVNLAPLKNIFFRSVSCVH